MSERSDPLGAGAQCDETGPVERQHRSAHAAKANGGQDRRETQLLSSAAIA